VAYAGKCQFQAMYAGLVDCARRTGKINRVHAQLVYECDADTFDVDLGASPKLTHKPNYKGERTLEKCIGAYAVAEWTDGGTEFEFMTRDEILAIKNSVRAKKGPWFVGGETAEGQMWKKTPLRRLMKRMPMSVELLSYFREEDKAMAPREVEYEEVDATPAATDDLNALAARETTRAAQPATVAQETAESFDFFSGTQEAAPALPDFLFDCIPVPPDLTWERVAETKIPTKNKDSAIYGQTFGSVRRDGGLLPLLENAVQHGIECAKAGKAVPEGALFSAVTKHLVLKDDEKEQR
jgi:hypothetical protein